MMNGQRMTRFEMPGDDGEYLIDEDNFVYDMEGTMIGTFNNYDQTTPTKNNFGSQKKANDSKKKSGSKGKKDKTIE
jgi:hypothetical protein